MAKSNTNKRYAIRKLGKIFGSAIIGLTLFLGGIRIQVLLMLLMGFNMSEMILEIKKRE